jgi:hypothetical protein
MMLCSGNF